LQGAAGAAVAVGESLRANSLRAASRRSSYLSTFEHQICNFDLDSWHFGPDLTEKKPAARRGSRSFQQPNLSLPGTPGCAIPPGLQATTYPAFRVADFSARTRAALQPQRQWLRLQTRGIILSG